MFNFTWNPFKSKKTRVIELWKDLSYVDEKPKKVTIEIKGSFKFPHCHPNLMRELLKIHQNEDLIHQVEIHIVLYAKDHPNETLIMKNSDFVYTLGESFCNDNNQTETPFVIYTVPHKEK